MATKRQCERAGGKIDASLGDTCPKCKREVDSEDHPRVGLLTSGHRSSKTDSKFGGVSTLLWGLTCIAALVAGLILAVTVSQADSAPQEAAGAAMAVGIAVIPYVFARSVEAISG